MESCQRCTAHVYDTHIWRRRELRGDPPLPHLSPSPGRSPPGCQSSGRTPVRWGRVIRLFIGGFNSGCNNHLAGNRENADIHAVRFGIPANIRVDQLRELPDGDIVGPAAGRVGVDDGRGGLRAVGVGICFASMPAANAPNRFIVKPLSQVGHLYCFKDTVMSLYAVPSS